MFAPRVAKPLPNPAVGRRKQTLSHGPALATQQHRHTVADHAREQSGTNAVAWGLGTISIHPLTRANGLDGSHEAPIPAGMPIRPKLAVSGPGEALEQEADRVADRVTQGPFPEQHGFPFAPTVQRNPMADVEQEKSFPQITRDRSDADAAPAPIVLEVLRSPGQPLDPAARAYFESRLGHDFAGVRTHNDGVAARSAAAVNALAYTAGRHIVFGAGQYAPSSDAGRRLLGHELAHVVQQDARPASDVSRGRPRAVAAPMLWRQTRPPPPRPRDTTGPPPPRPQDTTRARIERFLRPDSPIWRQLNPNETSFSNCPATAAAVDEYLSTGRITPAPPGQPASTFIVISTGGWSDSLTDFRHLFSVLDRPQTFVVVEGTRPHAFAEEHGVTDQHYFEIVRRRHGFLIIDAFGHGQAIQGLHDMEDYARREGFASYKYYFGAAFRVQEHAPEPVAIPDTDSPPDLEAR